MQIIHRIAGPPSEQAFPLKPLTSAPHLSLVSPIPPQSPPCYHPARTQVEAKARNTQISSQRGGGGLHLQRKEALESWCGCGPPGRLTRLSSQHRCSPPLGTSQYSSCSEFACYRTSWKPAVSGREGQVEPCLGEPSPSNIREPPEYLRDGDATFLGKLLFGLLTRIRVAQVGVEIFIQDLSGLFAEVPAFPSAGKHQARQKL